MKTVGIVGVGLIGGSFGLALRAAGFKGEILGVSSARQLRPESLAAPFRAGATFEEAAARADLIYLAQPVDRILRESRHGSLGGTAGVPDYGRRQHEESDSRPAAGLAFVSRRTSASG